MEIDHGKVKIDFGAEALDIIVVAGQSNADGRGLGEGGEYTPNENVLFARPEFTTRVIEGRGEVATYSGKVMLSDSPEHWDGAQMRGNLMSGFVPLYAAERLKKGRKLLVLITAVGGTGFALGQWGVGKPLYDKTIELTRAFMSLSPHNKTVALLWHQGEHDAFENADMGPEKRAEIYRSSLSELVRDFRTRFGDVPFVCGDFTPNWRVEYPVSSAAVREGAILACRDVGRAAFVGTDDLTDNRAETGVNDTVHFSSKALKTLGARYYERFDYIDKHILENIEVVNYPSVKADVRDFPCDIIVMAGQSNCEGNGLGGTPYAPIEDVYFARPEHTMLDLGGGEKIACRYTGRMDVSLDCEELSGGMTESRVAAAGRFSPIGVAGKCGNLAAGFVPEYAKHYLSGDRKLLVVLAAVGGTGFAHPHWGLGDRCYLKMLECVDWALSLNKGNRVVGLLWHQGEHDSYVNENRDAEQCRLSYEKNIGRLLRDFRERYGCVPFVAADFVPQWRAGNPIATAAVAQGTRDVCAAEGRAAFIGTDDLLDNAHAFPCNDNIHFCRDSLAILGKRYFDAFDEIMKEK